MKHLVLRQLDTNYWRYTFLPFNILLLLCLIFLLVRGCTHKEMSEAVCVEVAPGVDSNVVVTDDNANCSRGIDMVFILDVTSSMEDEIYNLRNSIERYADKVKEVSNGKYRFGLITVHGESAEPQYALSLALAPANEDDLSNALLAVGLSNGAEFPEPTDDALEAVLDNTVAYGPFRNSRNKIIVLITDAVPSGGDDVYYEGVDDVRAAALANKARSQNVRIFALNTGGGVANSSVISVMENYAFTTYGQYAESSSGRVASEIILALDKLCSSK